MLDAEAISDFDSTAAEALETLDADLERRGVDFWIARANAPLRELLTATGLMKRLEEQHIYPSVRAAVAAYRRAVRRAGLVGGCAGALALAQQTMIE